AARERRGAGGVAEADRLFREQSPSHGLPELPSAWLGHRQRADGGGLQDHRRALEGFGHALGGGRSGDGGGLTRAVRQRGQTLGRLLGATPSQGGMKSPK